MVQSETDSSNNNNNVYNFPVFGARFPTTPTISRRGYNPYRTAARTDKFEWSEGKEVAVIPETLTKGQKIRLEDAFIIDQTIRRGVTLYAKFLLGKRTKTAIDINKEFMTEEIRNEALKTTFSQSEIDDLKTNIDKVNRQVNFRDKAEAAVIQALVGGRSALLVEKQGQMPMDLKVLNWGKLGKVYADPDDWKMIGVDYADRKREEGPLLAEEIIYFTWQDYHVSPDSLYHGSPHILPVLDMSETIRIITQEDLKESAKIGWADTGAIKFPPNTSEAKMREFVEKFAVGSWNATSQSVEIESHGLQPKLREMMEIIIQGRRIIQQGLGLPSAVMQFEEIQNRATAELALNGWRESDLNHARSWLQGILEPQWFDSLIQIKYPDLDINNLWVKAKLEFEDVTFETLKDRAEAVIPLFQAGMIPLEKALKILDMEDVLEQMLAEQKKMEKQRAQELEMMKIEREERETTGGNGKAVPKEEEEEEEEEEPPKVRQRRASQEIEKQKYIEELKQAAISNAVARAEQQPPSPPKEDIQIKLKEAEHKLRMQLWEEQLSVTKDLKKRLTSMESPN